MGICLSCCYEEIKNFNNNELCIKLPHGLNYIKYCNNTNIFIKYSDINIWLKSLYNNKNWLNWIVYNDQINKIGHTHTKKGHCKGILTWNNNKIGWLCHSTPNFPKYFDGNDISDIEKSELIFGQCFQYVEINYNENTLDDILLQIDIMQANIYIEKYNNKNRINANNIKLKKINLSNTITHIAKSPHYEIDIYSNYLVNENNDPWYIETWMRGHKIDDDYEIIAHHKIKDISELKFEDINYNEKQDHSKWATTQNMYWVGDLNRMKSQYKRGGGGFIIKDVNISNSLYKLIIK